MKNLSILLIVSAIFFIFSCAPQMQDGNVVLKTPQFISTPNFNVLDGSSDPVSTADQNRYRYEIVVDAGGKRIAFIQLKRNEQKVISVPSGMPLDFYVGVYYAKNGETMDEEYNVYLASASYKGIQLMNGESKELEFVLDMNQKSRVDSYYTPDFGVNSVTGGVIDSAGNTVFSIRNNSSVQTKLVRNNSATGEFDNTTQINNLTASVIGTNTGNGILTRVKGTPPSEFWYISPSATGFRISATGLAGSWGTQALVNYSNYQSFLNRLIEIKSFSFGPVKYYFWNYSDGYLSLAYNGGFGSFGNIHITAFNHIYPQEPFLMDLEQDGTGDFAFFASKIGTFYVQSSTLAWFPAGEYQKGINEFQKLIRIQNPKNLIDSLMIRKVKTIGNKIYLGTRRGVYSIDKTSSEWISFQNAPFNEFRVFPVDKIKKEAGFEDEVIVSFDESVVAGKGTILTISTPKRVIFKNLTNGKEDKVSVWDGLPFTPMAKVANSAQTNTIDFKVHDAAEINFVLWNATSQRFWIGTNYGIASVHLSKLNL